MKMFAQKRFSFQLERIQGNGEEKSMGGIYQARFFNQAEIYHLSFLVGGLCISRAMQTLS